MFATYTPSGRFSPIFVIFLLLGLLPIAFLVYVYQLGLHWIPFIYINFLLTAGIGFAVGIVGNFVIEYGKVRNVLIGIMCALFLSASGLGMKYWFQYSRDHQERQNIGLATEPDDYSFADHLGERVEQGWRVGRGNGVPISGIFVYVIWLIEAGIIVGISGLTAIGATSQPFSEKLNCWADESEEVMSLPISNQVMINQINSAQSVDQLLEIPIPKTAESNQFAIYTVNSIPGEEMEDAYLSVELKTHTVNKKGAEEVNSDTLVEYAILSSQQRCQLRENASLLQEAITAYQQSLAENATTDNDQKP